SVVLDPFHEQPDGSDARWAFVSVEMSWDEYQGKYPKSARRLAGVAAGRKLQESEPIDIPDAGWDKFVEDQPNWFLKTKDHRGIRVTDYWYVEYEDRRLHETPDGDLLWADEVPEGTDTKNWETRTVTEQTVCWLQTNGLEVLDETDWPG